VPVRFVGHPLLDILPEPQHREEARRRLGLDSNRRVLGLLPGSRRRELASHFPVMLESAALLRKKVGDFMIVVPLASTLRTSDFQPFLESRNDLPEIRLVEGPPGGALGAMDAAVIKSGTATLEAALMGVPMVVVYRTNPLTYALASLLAEVPHVGLVNIVAGKRLVPERVQKDFNPESIVPTLVDYLGDPPRMETLRQDLLSLRGRLGQPGCFRRSAREILSLLDGPAAGTGEMRSHG